MASKTALVTGSSDGGIGSAIVKALLKHGFHVFATTRSIKSMSTIAHLPNVTLLAMDVTSDESIAEALQVVTVQTGGKLDLLVNNAGQGLVGPTTDVPMDSIRRLFDVNVFGLIAVTQAFVDLVVKAQGMILNIGSLGGQIFQPFTGLYNATKAAVEAYSETQRLELAHFNVKVQVVMAGGVKTAISENMPRPPLREGSLWAPTEDEKLRKFDKSRSAAFQQVDVFAEHVVSDALRGKTGRTYRGKYSSVVSFAQGILPGWALDSLLTAATAGRFEKTT